MEAHVVDRLHGLQCLILGIIGFSNPSVLSLLDLPECCLPPVSLSQAKAASGDDEVAVPVFLVQDLEVDGLIVEDKLLDHFDAVH